jgi:HEAT repeat protein
VASPSFSDAGDLQPSLETILRDLKNGNQEAKKNAVTALKKIDDKEAVEPLMDALKDVDSDANSFARAMILNALVKINDPRVIELFMGRLNDPAGSSRIIVAAYPTFRSRRG